MQQESFDDFLRGGGEMGSLMRLHDWASTPLAEPHSWPQGLRTAIRILLNTGHPMYIFWGAEGHCFYNDAYRLSIGDERHPSSLGKPAREVWGEIWHIIGPQIEQVMQGRGATWHENALVPITRNGTRENVYWTYSYGPIDDIGAATGIGGVLVVCTETTAQIAAAEKLAKSAVRLQMALSAGRGVGTWDWDVQNDRVVADDRFARLYGVDPEMANRGSPIDDFFSSIHPDDIDNVKQRVSAAIESGGTFSEEYRLIQPDGSLRWVVAEGRCSFDSDGSPTFFPGISFDITDRKRSEEQIRTLLLEVNHRVKNQFSVILSMIRETTKRANSPSDFENQIRQRIMALSNSQDLLVQADWAGADISELIFAHVKPFLSDEQVKTAGPKLLLSANATQYLGIALHELATNAVKYGALSGSLGSLDIAWQVDPTETGAKHLKFCWQEHGGGPAIEPSHKGFGTVVLKRVTPQALNGTGSLQFLHGGLSWTLIAPLTEMVGGSSVS